MPCVEYMRVNRTYGTKISINTCTTLEIQRCSRQLPRGPAATRRGTLPGEQPSRCRKRCLSGGRRLEGVPVTSRWATP